MSSPPLRTHCYSDSYDPEFQNEYLKLVGKETIMPDGIAHARPARKPIFQQSADGPTRALSAASYSVEKCGVELYRFSSLMDHQ
jgi:hypothetical protein